MRVCDETARSRLTESPCAREPRFVRRRVSGATPTVKEESVKEVTVRQVPLTLMESPSLQSTRTGAALEMVRVVPPDASEGLRAETTRGGG
jgi:hypothetical protein